MGNGVVKRRTTRLSEVRQEDSRGAGRIVGRVGDEIGEGAEGGGGGGPLSGIFDKKKEKGGGKF